MRGSHAMIPTRTAQLERRDDGHVGVGRRIAPEVRAND
jgi:hypothetical protein